MKIRILCFVLTMAMVLSVLVVVSAVSVSADSAINIGTLAEFKAFRDAVNNGDYDSGVTAKLTADIDISDENWTPIGNSTSHPFKGTFINYTYHILIYAGSTTVNTFTMTGWSLTHP